MYQILRDSFYYERNVKFQVLTRKYIVRLNGHTINLYLTRTFCHPFTQRRVFIKEKDNNVGHVNCRWQRVNTSLRIYPVTFFVRQSVIKTINMDGTAPGLPQREMALTLDGLKGSEILHTEQRLGQLPDEQLQQAGRIVLFDAFPIESPFIKLRFQFLAKILKGRRRGKKKKKLQVHFFFFPAESVIHFPLSKRVYSLEKNLKVLKANSSLSLRKILLGHRYSASDKL